MKAVLFMGGYGSRLAEYTDNIPKPMIDLGGRPIILHIMDHYRFYGIRSFHMLLGYKAKYVKNYFIQMLNDSVDLRIDYSRRDIKPLTENSLDIDVSLHDTGLDSLTGRRLNALRDFDLGDNFMLTYGDGLSNIDLGKLYDFHLEHNRILTMTVVRPTARFGEVGLDEHRVSSFIEKPQINDGWINGGFFVANKRIFDYLDGNDVMFEREPMQRLVADAQVAAYRHTDFWACMDTKRDKDRLEDLWQSGAAPWHHGNIY